MKFPTLVIVSVDGQTEIEVPYVQYPLNSHQTICIVGVPDGSEVTQPNGGGLVEWEVWGQMEDINFIFQSMATNSLIRDDWDFETYPNPWILIGDHIERAPEANDLIMVDDAKSYFDFKSGLHTPSAGDTNE